MEGNGMTELLFILTGSGIAVAALVMALALTGCAEAPTQPSYARWPSSHIEIHWQRKQDVGNTCRDLGLPSTEFNGCARSKPTDVNVCEVYAVQPNSFADAAALQVLGHETWHCLGAVHN
jgi:hypothetical protein